MKIIIKILTALMMTICLTIPFSFAAATMTATIGTYSTEVTKGSTFNVPVSVQMTGSNSTSYEVTVTLNPSSGLNCDSAVKTISFTADGTQSTSFSVTAVNDGTYTNPFSATASATGLTSNTKATCDTLEVIEAPVWDVSLSGDDIVVCNGDSIAVSMTFGVTPSGTIQSSLDVPTGLTLTAGSSSINYGSIASGQSSWTLVANSNIASTNTVTLTMTSDDPVSSTSRTLAITKDSCGGDDPAPPSSSSSSSSGSSSGGGGVIPTTERKTVNFTANIMNRLSFDPSKNFMKEIQIKARKTMKNIAFSVKKLYSKPTDLSTPKIDKAYKYLEITHGDLSNDDITEAYLSFVVEKAWLKNNNENRNNVVLLRYVTNKWEELETDYYNFDDTYYYFKAKSNGLSYFAIGTKKFIVVDTTDDQTTEPSDDQQKEVVVEQQQGTDDKKQDTVDIIQVDDDERPTSKSSAVKS
ncbi:MAG: PGF-pre-PGF domain-containing protein, partial [Candidatus Aenigmarchaeota archaeon]|nr:PGF-pre-PGF domain-containing protein [Candidatus Aenigmarchaeota archaeon]